MAGGFIHILNFIKYSHFSGEYRFRRRGRLRKYWSIPIGVTAPIHENPFQVVNLDLQDSVGGDVLKKSTSEVMAVKVSTSTLTPSLRTPEKGFQSWDSAVQRNTKVVASFGVGFPRTYISGLPDDRSQRQMKIKRYSKTNITTMRSYASQTLVWTYKRTL